jgi:hypothetical protein
VDCIEAALAELMVRIAEAYAGGAGDFSDWRAWPASLCVVLRQVPIRVYPVEIKHFSYSFYNQNE